LPPEIPQYFLPVHGPSGEVIYEPAILGAATIHFIDDKTGVDLTRDLLFAAPVANSAAGVDWDAASDAGCSIDELEKTAEMDARFGPLPPAAALAKNYPSWGTAFSTWLLRTQKIELMWSPALGEISRPGESERDFRIRLQQAAHEKRDQLKAVLQGKYGPKFQQLQQRKARAEHRKAVEQEQSSSQILNTVITAGAGILGAFMGRKAMSQTTISKAAQAVRSASRAAKEYGDVGRADETTAMIEEQIQDLNARFEAEIAALDTKVDPTTEAFEMKTVRPKKAGIRVHFVALGWKPR
jgi:hypothetical protein